MPASFIEPRFPVWGDELLIEESAQFEGEDGETYTSVTVSVPDPNRCRRPRPAVYFAALGLGLAGGLAVWAPTLPVVAQEVAAMGVAVAYLAGIVAAHRFMRARAGWEPWLVGRPRVYAGYEVLNTAAGDGGLHPEDAHWRSALAAAIQLDATGQFDRGAWAITFERISNRIEAERLRDSR